MDTLVCNYEIWISLAKTALDTRPIGETVEERFSAT